MKKYIRSGALVMVSLMMMWSGCSSPLAVRDQQVPEQYVVMLSMDGFRYDYAQRVATPNLDQMAAQGVMARYVIPAFPSKTFPNHYSMATGLYPANHGIVNNSFYCPELDLSYRIGDREAVENGAFYGGEPIWVTAEKQGLTSASYFWVGSEAPVQGIQPTYWKEYDSQVSFASRIDTVVSWLSLPLEQRPRLITFYFNQPDSQGHRSGPDSPDVDQVVATMDSLVGVLRHKLNQLDIAGQINLIVTSDHGMTPLSQDRYVDLEKYLKREWFEQVQGGNPIYSLQPREGMTDSVINALKDVEHISLWKTGDIPARFHYRNNPRILDMVVLADTTWNLGWGQPRGNYMTGGGHGWDNHFSHMRTIFYATGPAFRKNHLHEPFEVVDLYPLIAHLLGLQPAPVDGKLGRVEGMLED